MVGGYDASGNPMASAELYDPVAGTFTATGNMSTVRAQHTATLLNDGTVLIAGGFDSSFNSLASAEIYNPSAGTFTGVGSLATGRVSHTATLLNNGQVAIIGGEDASFSAITAAELYDPVSRTFTVTTARLNTGRYLHTATLLNTGMVLVAGGVDSSFTSMSSAELFNPAAGTFSVSGAMSFSRVQHAATLLGDGTVLISGGQGFSGSTYSSTELFDPVAGQFSASGFMVRIRYNHSATRLLDGTVLLVGGQGSDGIADATSELYAPVSLTPPNLVWIMLSPATPTISVGTAQKFTATGAFSDSSTQVLSSATWTSSDNTLATMTNDSTNRGQAFGVAAGSVTVTACAGSICGSTGMTVSVASLSITGLDPGLGPIGAPVIISGTGFGASQGTSSVKFNGTTATVGIWTDSAIVTTVPTGATTGNVVVTVAGVDSNGIAFTVGSDPIITSMSPSAGSVGTSITISGANFGATQGTSVVTFNGKAATATSWSATSIVVQVPANATSGNLVVTAAGVASNATPFIVTPAIASLSPTSGNAGTSVSISGTSFGQNQGSVTFAGATATVSNWSDTNIVVTVPLDATTGNVVVNAIGVSSFQPSNGVNFTFTPVIASLSPSAGPPLTLVNINGSGFGATQGTNTVSVNGVSASPVSWSSTNILVPVPAAASSGSVTVPISGVTSNGLTFTVTTAGSPAISATVYPPPALGWSRQNTTVTFVCSDGGVPIGGCPAAQTITTEGTGQVISGSVTTATGTASTSVTLNLDKTAPTLTVASPVDNVVVTDSYLTVTGTSSDGLSGLIWLPATKLARLWPEQTFRAALR